MIRKMALERFYRYQSTYGIYVNLELKRKKVHKQGSGHVLTTQTLFYVRLCS